MKILLPFLLLIGATATGAVEPAPTDLSAAHQLVSLVDYLAGREVEIDAIWGEPLRRAEKAGVSMPHLRRLYEDLLRCVEKQS